MRRRPAPVERGQAPASAVPGWFLSAFDLVPVRFQVPQDLLQGLDRRGVLQRRGFKAGNFVLLPRSSLFINRTRACCGERLITEDRSDVHSFHLSVTTYLVRTLKCVSSHIFMAVIKSANHEPVWGLIFHKSADGLVRPLQASGPRPRRPGTQWTKRCCPNCGNNFVDATS